MGRGALGDGGGEMPAVAVGGVQVVGGGDLLLDGAGGGRRGQHLLLGRRTRRTRDLAPLAVEHDRGGSAQDPEAAYDVEVLDELRSFAMFGGAKLVVIEHKGERHPRITIESSDGKILDFHYLPAKARIEVKDGEKIAFGKRQLEARATPGHTNSCMTYVLDDQSMAFTGDALLIRGCGRTDFQQGDPAALYRSVRQRILSLPAACLLYPAHDYQNRRVSSIGQEKRRNPRLGHRAQTAPEDPGDCRILRYITSESCPPVSGVQRRCEYPDREPA